MIRKCPKCDTWNDTETHCKSCGYVLDYKLQRKMEEAAKEEERKNRPPDSFDIFLEKMKTSWFLPFRIIYYLFFYIWVTLVAIVSFFLFMIAAGPG